MLIDLVARRALVALVLVALTAGELSWDSAARGFRSPESAPLPPSLKERLSDEPRWIDLRRYRDAPGDARFTELAADFAAAIHGIPKEDLLSQEMRQQRRHIRHRGVHVAIDGFERGWHRHWSIDLDIGGSGDLAPALDLLGKQIIELAR